MTFVIRTDTGDVIATRDTFEEAQRVAMLNATVNTVIEDETGDVLARMTFTPNG